MCPQRRQVMAEQSPLVIVPDRHGSPTATQVPPVQQLSPAQASPVVQQGWPGAPQVSQLPAALQPRPASGAQLRSGQQRSPAWRPHALHPALHVVKRSLQNRPSLSGAGKGSLQQGCPSPPHDPQPPAAHTPSTARQSCPGAMHAPRTQQPPSWHAFPAQHERPGNPQ
jgi:hypothetical protein